MNTLILSKSNLPDSHFTPIDLSELRLVEGGVLDPLTLTLLGIIAVEVGIFTGIVITQFT